MMTDADNTALAEEAVRSLIERGVVVHCPGTVEVGMEVDPARIAPGVVIHSGCRLHGAKLAIGPGSVIGEEAPVTLEDCRLGHAVSLNGGFFAGSTFLDGVQVGSCAHVRPGTLVEEGASAAHSVGFKQTIIFPFATVGSLVNFCDCLLAGGTSPKDHSEVGSSYIHFNFTPQQDKATASLLGDVPQGVMLDKKPVFLGGQGGLVGPTRLNFGTVVAAGVVCRQDVLEEGLLYTGRSGAASGGRPRKFRAGAYSGVGRLFRNNFHYLGNILALHTWYLVARKRLMASDLWRAACLEGAVAALDLILDERLRRLEDVALALANREQAAVLDADTSARERVLDAFERLRAAWHDIQVRAGASERPRHDLIGSAARGEFLTAWERIPVSTPYLKAIAALDASARKAGTAWLQAIVAEVADYLPEESPAPAGKED